MTDTEHEAIYVVHREPAGSGAYRWAVLECRTDRLEARVIAVSHTEEFAYGLVSALSDEHGRRAFAAGVMDAESPF